MKRTHFNHFNIAGFTFYEGVLAFKHLEIGTGLTMKPEPGNRYDENAVAIYYNEHKLGYVPRSQNKAIATILGAGQNIFEMRVQQLIPDASPEQQVQVVVFVTTNKNE